LFLLVSSYFFVSDYVCYIKLTTLTFSVYVKLLYRMIRILTGKDIFCSGIGRPRPTYVLRRKLSNVCWSIAQFVSDNWAPFVSYLLVLVVAWVSEKMRQFLGESWSM